MSKDQDKPKPLPQGVREKHGAWHYVRDHKWTKLCRVAEGRPKLYLRLFEVAGGEPGSVWHLVLSYVSNGLGELSEATKKKYRSQAVSMLHHFGHMQNDHVQATHIKQFLVWCKDSNRAVAGNREKSFLSSAFEYGMGRGWTIANPCRGVRRNRERQNRTYVEHSQLVPALDRAPPELYSLMGIAYLLAIRQTDLRMARQAQDCGKILKVTESKTGKVNEHEITPTVRLMLNKAAEHRESVARRYDAAAERLEKLSQKRRAVEARKRADEVRDQPYIFLSNRGHHWSEWGLQSALRRFGAPFQFRQLRPKAQTDAQDKNPTGHHGQMRGRYTVIRKLRAVK